MRKFMILACLVATGGNFATAGMPYFNNSGSPATTATQQVPKQSGGWKLPQLWGKKSTVDEPQFFSQAPAKPPTATERLASAMTDNVAVNTARSWISPKAKPSTSSTEVDVVSLAHPTGKPTPALIVSMAQLREKQGDLAGARQMYQQALAAGPKNVKTLREAGHFEDRQNRLVDAERYYAEAAKLAPENAAVLNDLALCLARQGKVAPAAQILESAIRLAPDKALYRNNMATVLMEVGDQHTAMQHLLAVHPPATAYYNMGHLLEKGGQADAAAAHYAEACRLDPSLQAAQVAHTRLVPASPAGVPQTAMVAASATPGFASQEAWPSEPLLPAASASMADEPEFGPRLLPPLE